MMTDVARIEGRRPAAWRRSSLLIPAAIAAFALPGCGDQEDASLCTAFGELLAARAAVAAIDPQNHDAEQAKDAVESYSAGVRRLRQAADDRYEQQLFGLEAAVDDVRLTLAPIPDDAEFATWSPLVEDDLEALADAATQVENAIEPSCNPDTSGD
jgi:hypothetical protein